MIVPALLISIVGGTLIGAVAGWTPQQRFEKVTVTGSLLLHSAPSFVVGIFALMVFSYQLAGSRGRDRGGGGAGSLWGMIAAGDYLEHLILPCLVLASREITGPILLLRNSMLEVKGSDFIDILQGQGPSQPGDRGACDAQRTAASGHLRRRDDLRRLPGPGAARNRLLLAGDRAGAGDCAARSGLSPSRRPRSISWRSSRSP